MSGRAPGEDGTTWTPVETSPLPLTHRTLNQGLDPNIRFERFEGLTCS